MAGRAPCRRLPGALLAPQQRHFHARAAQHSGTLHRSQLWACWLDMLMMGDPESPGSMLHTHSIWASPAAAAAAPGLGFGFYSSRPWQGCCCPRPHHGPRAHCKEEMVAAFLGLCCLHPFVPICEGGVSSGVPPPP